MVRIQGFERVQAKSTDMVFEIFMKCSSKPSFITQECTTDHMVGHPRCVFINYIWLNQLSNTTNLWSIDVSIVYNREDRPLHTTYSQSTAEILRRDHHHNYVPLPLFRGFPPENNKTLQTRRREIKKTNNSIYYNQIITQTNVPTGTKI